MDHVAVARRKLAELDRAIAERQELLAKLHEEGRLLKAQRDQLRQFVELSERLFPSQAELLDESVPGSSRASGEGVRGGLGPVMARIVADRAAMARFSQGMATGPRVLSPRRQIADAAEEIIRLTGPKATRDLVTLLEERGEQIGGSNKVASLSVTLSRDDRFRSVRDVGWTLRNSQKKENPEGAGTPSGSSADQPTLPVRRGSGTATGLPQEGGDEGG